MAAIKFDEFQEKKFKLLFTFDLIENEDTNIYEKVEKLLGKLTELDVVKQLNNTYIVRNKFSVLAMSKLLKKILNGFDIDDDNYRLIIVKYEETDKNHFEYNLLEEDLQIKFRDE